MLWLCLHLPQLPLEVFTRGATNSSPRAVCDGPDQHRQVLCANAEAIALGLRVGQPAALAAGGTGISYYARETRLEHQALTGLADWAGQFTPAITLLPGDGLLLEVSGSLRLFGGARALYRRLRDGIHELGYTGLLSMAPTPRGATWLARAGRSLLLHDQPALTRALMELPLSVLDLKAAQHKAFHRLGITTLGECQRLPREGLTQRLGTELLTHLDQAFGLKADPREYFVPSPRFDHRLELPSPVSNREALAFAANRLLAELTGALAARRAGTRQLQFELEHEDREPGRFCMNLVRASREAAHLRHLLYTRLETQPVPAAVTAVRLRADFETLAEVHASLFEAPEEMADTRLIERLRARLGETAVHGLALVPGHRPERAFRYCAPGDASAQAGPAGPVMTRRPVWLLAAARPLPIRNDTPYFDGPLRYGAGERIESGWWDDNPVLRDYFVARNPRGACLWIYREIVQPRRWFLHGFFA